jgi:hypothetical protein
MVWVICELVMGIAAEQWDAPVIGNLSTWICMAVIQLPVHHHLQSTTLEMV